MPLPKGCLTRWDSLCPNSYLLKSIDKRSRLVFLGSYFLICKIWAITTATPTDDRSLLPLTMIEANNKHRHGGDDVNEDRLADDNP